MQESLRASTVKRLTVKLFCKAHFIFDAKTSKIKPNDSVLSQCALTIVGPILSERSKVVEKEKVKVQFPTWILRAI